MKKLIIILAFLLIPAFAFSADGDIENPINVLLSDSARSEVSLGVNQKCRSYGIQSRGGEAIKIYKTETSTEYWTLKAGLSIRAVVTIQGATLFWAQSVSGAETVEVILTNDY